MKYAHHTLTMALLLRDLTIPNYFYPINLKFDSIFNIHILKTLKYGMQKQFKN